jgi:phage-related protein
VTDVFNEILTSIGDRLPGLFENIANSLINLSSSINPDQFAALAVGILNIIPALTNMIAGLTRAQQVMQPWFDAIMNGFREVLPALQELFAAFGGASSAGVVFQALGLVVTGTAKVLTVAIRLVTAQVNRARAVFTGLATLGAAAWTRLSASTRAQWNAIRNTIASVVGSIRAIVSAAWATVSSITLRAWASIRGAVGRSISGVRSVVVGGWNAITSATSGAWSRISGVVSRAVGSILGFIGRLRGGININWSGLSSGLSGAVGTIRGLINSAIDAVNALISAINRIPAINLPNIPGFAGGVRNFGGGLAVVGERGPELLALPGGSSVFSNNESRRMISGAQPVGGNQTNNLTIINNGPAAGADLLRDITWSLKYAVGAGVRTSGAF